MPKIYFRDGEKAKNIKELLQLLYASKSLRDPNDIGSRNTYFDKELTVVQCQYGRYRSFDDLLLITKTYFPSTGPENLFKEILLFEKDGQKFKMYNCSYIDRIIVYCKDALNNHHDYDSVISLNFYDSEYSWLDLFRMLDINSQEDLNKFIAENSE